MALIDSLAPSKAQPRAVARFSALPWLLGAAAVVFLALTFRPAVEGDGVGYYSYLHAVFVSHNLSFESEYLAARASGAPLYLPWVTTRENGHLTDMFPVGSAVLSAPFYLGALAFHPSGEPQYGGPLSDSFALSSLLFGLLGLALSYAIASAVVGDRRSALIGMLAGVLTTTYAYYLLSDPSYAHTFSVFAVSAFVFAWWKGPPATWWGWLGLGVLGGLMGLVRFQDGLIAAVVLIDFRRLRWPALAFVPGMVIGFAPQLVVDLVQFGGLLPERAAGEALNPLNARYVDVLFGSWEGLFIWTPAAFVAVAGVVLLKDRRMQIAAGLALLLEVLVIGSAPDSSGASLGPRRFLDLTPFAIVGFAAAARAVRPWQAWAGLAALSAWNALLLANFEYVLKPGGDPGYVALTIGQFDAVRYVPRLFAKGVVLRDLFVGSEPVQAAIWLVLEAVCVGVGFLAVSRAMRAERHAIADR